MENRIIKFRAWDDGVMIYSDDHILTDNNKQLEQFFKIIREDAPIMQFTGLKDKNVKEIYEGDIVEFYLPKHEPSDEEEYIEAVVFNEGCFTCEDNIPLYGIVEFGCEIKGNIYENKNLLPTE